VKIKRVLAGVFILLTPITASASKEIKVESITCPDTITIGIKEGGKPKGTKTLEFEEYLKV
jgi:hypothetical protein